MLPTADPSLEPAVDDPATTHRTPWYRTVASGVAFVVVAVAVQLAREPDARTWNTIWAEDGLVFTADALRRPAVDTIFAGYNGYAQTVPRILALGTRVLPASWYAAYLATAAAVVTALLGLVVVRSARGWVANPVLRWSLGAMLVAAPVIYAEINVAVTNLGWPLVAASFWAIASREEGRADTAVRGLTVAAAALTTATALVMLPWAIAVAVYRRRRSDFVVLGTFVVALVVQGVADLSTAAAPTGDEHDSGRLVDAFGVRVMGSLVTGERWLRDLWIEHGALLVVGSIVAVSIVVLLARPWRTNAERLLLAAGAVVVGVATYLVALWVRGSSAIDVQAPRAAVTLGGGRYAYVTIVLFFSAIVVLVDASRRRWLAAIVVAQVAFVVVSSLGLTTYRSVGPAWSTSVAAARQTCRADPTLEVVELPISPPAPSWHVTVPCTRLR